MSKNIDEFFDTILFKEIDKFEDFLSKNAEYFKNNLTEENNLKLRDCLTGTIVLNNLKAKLEQLKEKLKILGDEKK